MSLDVKAIEDALYLWVFGELSVKTIFADQNAPRPVGAYNSIKIIQTNSIGEEESDYSAAVAVPPANRIITAEHSNVYNLMVSINAFREDAHSNIIKLRDSISKITVQDLFIEKGLGYIDSSEIRDIPSVIDKGSEPRTQVDFFFYVRSTVSETIDEIKKIEITNEIDGTTTTIE